MANAEIREEQWVNGAIANMPEVQLYLKKQAGKVAMRAKALAAENAETGHLASTVTITKDLKWPSTYEVSFEDEGAAFIELGSFTGGAKGVKFIPGKYILRRAMKGK